jgi:regulatory protein
MIDDSAAPVNRQSLIRNPKPKIASTVRFSLRRARVRLLVMRGRRRKSNARDVREDVEEKRPARPVDAEKARERTLQRAVKLLAAKPRSVEELRERLLEKGWADEATVDYALEKLKGYGYLDDDRFAFGFASYRVKQKPVGRQRLARDLQMKKVARETADAALDLVFQETPEDELIAAAIEKRVRLRGRPATRAATKSLFDHLLRRGFSYDLIIRKVREIADADVEEDAPAPDDSRADAAAKVDEGDAVSHRNVDEGDAVSR